MLKLAEIESMAWSGFKHIFVMGDHRNNSQDSRHFGFVPKRYIVGKVQVRWWPVPTAHIF